MKKKTNNVLLNEELLTSLPIKYKLKNGLELAHIKTNCNLFRIQLVIRAGMLQENKNQIGFAHFIEHLMSFFPSSTYPNAKENQQEITTRGLNSNAWTSENNCGYYIEGLKDHFFTVLDLIFQNYIDPILDAEIFEQEKEAVIRELEGMTEDLWYNLEHMIQKVDYKNTILEYSLFEEIQNVKNNSRLENIMQYRKDFYCPQKTIIIITSNHSTTEINEIFQNIENIYFTNKHNKFGNISSFFIKPKHEQRKISFTPKQKVKNYDHFQYFFIKPPQKTDTYNIKIQFPIPFDEFSDDMYTLDFIHMILSGSMGSRLYYALRSELGSVYNVHTEHLLDPVEQKYNRFIIEVETNKELVKDTIDYILLELYALLYDEKLTQEEIKQKNNHIEMIINKNKCTQHFKKLTNIYENRLIWKKPLFTIQEIINKQKQIDYNQIIKVSKIIFKAKNMKIFYSGETPILCTKKTKHKHLTFR